MKKIAILFALVCCFGFTAQSQTQVLKVSALKSNDYGVRYTLPKTILKVDVEYSETIRKAGPYAKYASHYLGINESEIIMQDETSYRLEKAAVTSTGVPNKEKSYLVAFKPKTVAPFVSLTEDGLLCAINAEYEMPTMEPKTIEQKASESPKPLKTIYTEEYLRSGSVAKMAEVAAKNIYRIRENRQDILIGEAENMPQDGEAMKLVLSNLENQEQAWTELFIGTSSSVKHYKQITIEPKGEVADEVLFRFSKRLGLLDSDDLSGKPVYWNLKDMQTVQMPLFDPKKKNKEEQSLVYNIPGKGDLSIVYENTTLFTAVFDFTQFGITEIFATTLLEDKKMPVQIIFYPYLGAIREIKQ